MNKKGSAQTGIGLLIIAAVAIIVGAVLFQASAQQVGSTTNTITQTSQAVSAADFKTSVNFALKGHDVTSLTVTNATNPFQTVAAGNYTVTADVVQSDGTLRDTITPTAGAQYNNTAVNMTYTYSPDGYTDSSAARSVEALIIVFAGLAVAVGGIYAAFGGDFWSIVGGYA